jgi:hypothetical protein
LIGFERLNDIASDGTHLFISDANGVWKVPANRAMIADERPTKIVDLTEGAALTYHPKTQSVVVGTKNRIIFYDLKTDFLSGLFIGDKQAIALAYSPAGGLLATIKEGDDIYILPFKGRIEDTLRLELPPGAKLTDMHFWPKDKLPDAWPKEWAADMLVSVGGDEPMIARAHFNFGEIKPELTPLIDGFSKPSRIVGRRDVWGQPSALAIMPDGRLIFSEKENGGIWVLDKLPLDPENSVDPTPEILEQNQSEKPSKPRTPALIYGSSIESVSGLQHGSALEKDDLLMPAAKEEETKPMPE